MSQSNSYAKRASGGTGDAGTGDAFIPSSQTGIPYNSRKLVTESSSQFNIISQIEPLDSDAFISTPRRAPLPPGSVGVSTPSSAILTSHSSTASAVPRVSGFPLAPTFSAADHSAPAAFYSPSHFPSHAQQQQQQHQQFPTPLPPRGLAHARSQSGQSSQGHARTRSWASSVSHQTPDPEQSSAFSSDVQNNVILPPIPGPSIALQPPPAPLATVSTVPYASSSAFQRLSRKTSSPSLRSFASSLGRASSRSSSVGDRTPMNVQGQWNPYSPNRLSDSSASARSLPPSPPLTATSIVNSRVRSRSPGTMGSSSTGMDGNELYSDAIPLRLTPRSAKQERFSLDELIKFKDLDSERGRSVPGGDSDSITSSTSRNTSSTNARSLRLRQDIEKTAQLLRQMKSGSSSQESLGARYVEDNFLASSSSLLTPAASSSSSKNSPRDYLESSKRGSETSYVSVPSPLKTTFDVTASPVNSVFAFPSTEDSVSTSEKKMRPEKKEEGEEEDSLWITSQDKGKQAAEAPEDLAQVEFLNDYLASLGVESKVDDNTNTQAVKSLPVESNVPPPLSPPRPKEPSEWSQPCWMWVKGEGGPKSTGMVASLSGGSGGQSHSLLGKKSKSSKRDSHQVLSPAEALAFTVEDLRGKGSAGLKDKDKNKGNFRQSMTSKVREGRWKRVTSVLRDDGFLRIINEDLAVINAFHLPNLMRSDIFRTDPSLFGRTNCISIRRLNPAVSATSLPFPHSTSSKSMTQSPSFNSLFSVASQARAQEPLYLRMPTQASAQTWLVMACCFAKPELLEPIAFDRHIRVNSSERNYFGGRVSRSITLTINEGRCIGQGAGGSDGPPGLGPRSQSISKMSEDLRAGHKFSHVTTLDSASEYSIHESSSSPMRYGGAASALTSWMPRSNNSNKLSALETKEKDEFDLNQSEFFCEIEMEGHIVARSASKKGSNSPFWNEIFHFNGLAPFLMPISIHVYQSVKGVKEILLGTCAIRTMDLPRSEHVDDWWYVVPLGQEPRGKGSDSMGELNLHLRVNEDIVLAAEEYKEIMFQLVNDTDASLATELSHVFAHELEEVTKLLLRLYLAEEQLIARLLRLADLEVENNTKSAAILFRGNSILTKSIELLLRLIGTEFLEASIGTPIRRICAERIEVEIDPSRLRPGVKDKEVLSNIHELHEWTSSVWNSIYAAREKCPHDLREIFQHIREIVEQKYGQDNKNVRWTSISAFIFLRFFVPAILNPKAFFIVSVQPDAKSQRTLTLIAKTLQGLANFSTFGQKEPWMFAMNDLLQQNTPTFIKYIDHISKPSRESTAAQGTSPNVSAHLAPYRLRAHLEPHLREGIPLLPHAIDVPRDLGLLASYVVRVSKDKVKAPTDSVNGHVQNRFGGSERYERLGLACLDVHERSLSRAAGLFTSQEGYDTKSEGRFRSRPPITSPMPPQSVPITRLLSDHGSVPSTPPRPSDELHIRSTLQQSPVVPESPTGSAMSRRVNRSFTVNGTGGLTSPNGVIDYKSYISDESLSLDLLPQDVFAVRDPISSLSMHGQNLPRLDEHDSISITNSPGSKRPRSRMPTMRQEVETRIEVVNPQEAPHRDSYGMPAFSNFGTSAEGAGGGNGNGNSAKLISAAVPSAHKVDEVGGTDFDARRDNLMPFTSVPLSSIPMQAKGSTSSWASVASISSSDSSVSVSTSKVSVGNHKILPGGFYSTRKSSNREQEPKPISSIPDDDPFVGTGEKSKKGLFAKMGRKNFKV